MRRETRAETRDIETLADVSARRPSRQPLSVDAQQLGEKSHDRGSRHGLAAEVLADLALAELAPAGLSAAHEVDLLEPALLHGGLEPGRKRLFHHLAPKVQFRFTELRLKFNFVSR